MKLFKTLLKGTVLVTGAGLGVSHILLYLLSHRKGNVDFVFGKSCPPTEQSRNIDKRRTADYEWLTSQPLEHFHITSDDGLRLHASLLKSEKPSKRYVLAVHGYRCTGNKEFDSISRFYHEQGINVFMIDHRASGDSEGTYITYGAKEHEDCLKWLDYMLLTFGNDIEIALHGCSMGSATVMMLCGCDLPENVKFAVSDCGYSSLKEQLYHNFKAFNMPADICYPIYRQAAIHFADFDPNDVTPAKSLENCKIPVIFAHGDEDNFVPYSMVSTNYTSCSSPVKTLIGVDGADHVQSFQLSDEFREAINKYIRKYM